jgi:uncharacterized BrkB/YihY/UPF0761 family membrane protein
MIPPAAFGASSIFVELHDAMNTIWHVSLPLDRSNAATIIRLIRDRFYSFATVLGIGFRGAVGSAANLVPPAERKAAEENPAACVRRERMQIRTSASSGAPRHRP